MSDQEILRGQYMQQLQEGKTTQQQVAQRLDISVRQVRRLFKKYVQEGRASNDL